MGVIRDFGFNIFRLKEATEQSEFLIYDTTMDLYNQFSMRRGKDILMLYIEKITEKKLRNYILDEEYFVEDEKNKLTNRVIDSIFTSWINEDLELIDNLNYDPTKPLVFKDNYNRLYFNIYSKPKLLSKDYSDYQSKGFDIIKEIILNLVGHDEKGYNYFISWLAYQLQNPATKLSTSIILQGEQGSGKTLLCQIILREIFEKNFIEISQSQLTSDFNEYILGKQLIVANEVIYNEHKINYSQKLKNYVTDPVVTITRKFKEPINVNNFSHWIFCSNNQLPIKIERGDRRFTVYKSKTLDRGKNIFNKLIMNFDDEINSFVKYLLEFQVDKEYVNYPYMNSAKKDMLEASSNSIELFIDAIESFGGIDGMINEYKQKGFDSLYINLIQNSQSKYISIDSLYKLYLKFCSEAGVRNTYGRNGFTSMVKHLGLNVSITKEDNKSVRVVKVGDIK